MTDFHQGLLVGALIALYLAWMLGPVVRAELHRRRVLREAERRLTAAEARMRERGEWPVREYRRGSNPPPDAVKPPPPPSPPPMRVIREGISPSTPYVPQPQDDTQ